MISNFVYINNTIVPLFVATILLIAKLKGVQIYQVFTQGALEGFDIAVKLIPHLVAMLTAIGVARTSGLLDLLIKPFLPVLINSGFPHQLLPLALMRPLSGSASFSLMLDVLQTYGPDSLVGLMASTLQGSTDTTFYILAVYFGSVGVKRYRYALLVGLVADVVGMASAVLITYYYFGNVT